jgi:antirestriction protein ArdC
MKRDPYTEMSTRNIAELEAGAPWVEPWSATAGMNKPCNRDQSALLGMQHPVVVDVTDGRAIPRLGF